MPSFTGDLDVDLGRYLAGTWFLAMKRTHLLRNLAWLRRRVIELGRRFGWTLTVA